MTAFDTEHTNLYRNDNWSDSKPYSNIHPKWYRKKGFNLDP